jgi:hypothetical protein
MQAYISKDCWAKLLLKGGGMYKLLLFFVTLGLMFFSLSNADSLTVAFASKQMTGKWSPKRDVVIWIQDASGTFVRTLAVWGDDRADLGTWSTNSSRSVVDATTGATISTSSSGMTAKWNLKNVSQQTVANGTYWLCIEQTSVDNSSTNPRIKVKVVMDGSSKTLSIVDSSLNNGSTYITNVNVVLAISTRIIAGHYQYSGARQFMLLVGETPVAVPLRGSETIMVSLYSSDGARVSTRVLNASAQSNSAFLAFEEISAGKYLCKVKTSARTITKTVDIVR